MPTPFVGQLMAVAFNFPPKGWTFCNGQSVQISSNQALFSLLGTFYGGNGVTNFNLPNLQGQIPLGMGSSGFSNYNIGQAGGAAGITLTTNEVPPHGHVVIASSNAPSLNPAVGNALASNVSMYVSGSAPTNGMNNQSIAPAGGSVPHENRQPYLVINWCIALTGIFPSRT